MKPASLRLGSALVASLTVLAVTACNTLPAPRPIATWAPTIIASSTPTPGTPEPSATATQPPTATATSTPRPTSTPVPTATPIPLPSAKGETGWNEYQGPGKTFTISVPSAWKPSFVDSKTIQATISALTAAKPELTTLLSFMLAGGGAFAASDPTAAPSAAGVPTGVMVLKQPKGMIRSASLLAPLLASAAQLAEGVKKPIQLRKVQLSAGEAEEIAFRIDVKGQGGQPSSEIAQTIYLVDSPNDIYMIGLTTPADQAADYESTFQKIAESFTFTQK